MLAILIAGAQLERGESSASVESSARDAAGARKRVRESRNENRGLRARKEESCITISSLIKLFVGAPVPRLG